MFNNEAFLDFIDNKKDKNTKLLQTYFWATKYLWTYLVDVSQQGLQNEKFFIDW